MELVTIIGARPQFIKAATISRAIKNYSNVKETIVHTGQHYDANMSEVFFEELEIPKPDFHLGIGGGTHGMQTGKMLESIESVLIEKKPDFVLVYGDTNSTMAGSLAAAKLHIPVAHVEAGLRSFNRKMPEEINRILTDHISTLLFTPTQTAVNNLIKEGIDQNKIVNVGDVMFDAALFYGSRVEPSSSEFKSLNLTEKEFILTTIHRAENTDDKDRLRKIFISLERVAKNTVVVLPLHPRTKKQLESINFDFQSTSLSFISPVGYLDMVLLEKYAAAIVTDSGGVQKEAYFHKTPCVTLRNETEWTELVENGFNVLLKDLEKLPETIKEITSKEMPFSNSSLYGTGNAAGEIIETILKVHQKGL